MSATAEHVGSSLLPPLPRLLIYALAALLLPSTAWSSSFTYSLSAFSLDMTKGTLLLQFPVAMQSATLNASAIVLQSAASVGSAATDAWLRLSGDLKTEIPYNSTAIEVFLRNSDYYALQLDARIATTKDTTYIRVDSNLLKSVNLAGVTAIPNGYGMRASSYVPDRLPPFLLAFSLDMNTGGFNLTFNEPVSLPSFDPTAVTLQQQQDKIYDEAWEQYRLKDWNYHTLVGKGVNVTGVTRYHHTQQYSIGINQTYPYDFIGLFDGVPKNFTVTWDGHNYTYRTDPNASYWTTYDEYKGYGFTVHTNIGLTNLNAIKALAPLATSADTVYLAAYKSIVCDIAGNNMSTATVQDYLALPIATYIADTSRPTLNSFVLDMNHGVLELHFSETVNVHMLNVTGLCLQGTANWTSLSASAGGSFCLTPGISGSSQSAAAKVMVVMGEDDLNALKLLGQKGGLCTSVSNTYLSFPKSLAVDMAWVENSVVPVARTSALQASAVIADASSPVLKYFVLDWDERLLSLFFNEAIRASSVVITEITLQQSVNPGRSGSKYTLTSSSNVTSDDGPVLRIHIGFSDYAAIKLLPNLCSTPANTFISFPNNMVTDLGQGSSPNYVVPIAPSKAIPVKKYIPDTSAPYLRGFTLDLDANTITLVLSEPVHARSLNTTGVVLSSSTNGDNPYRLIDSATALSAVNDMTVLVYLGSNDIRSIKVSSKLCRGLHNCFASMDAGSVTDINDPAAPNPSIPQVRPVQATGYVADVTLPTLSSFDLDMNDGTLVLTFSEPVRASFLNCSAITFSSTATPASSPYHENATLSQYCVNQNDDGDRLSLKLWPSDVSRIKMLRYVCRGSSTTYMMLAEALVQDMFGNAMAAVTGNLSPAVQVGSYSPDLTGPVLLSWDLDKDTRRLRLHFDEAVNISTLQVSGITMQGYSSRLNLPWYTLTTSSSLAVYNTTHDGSVVDVTLGSTDMREITARKARMGSMQANSYLLLTRYTVLDTSGNRNQAIVDDSGLQLGPTLRRFYLDMDAGVLTLLFSRSVDMDSFQETGITLLNGGEDTATSSYTLKGTGDGGTLASAHGRTVVIWGLTDDDLSAIKNVGDLCLSAASTWVAIDPSTITDTDSSSSPLCCGGNNVVEVSTSLPLQVAWYTADVTWPRLQSWSLNMNTGIMTLYFNEPVDSASVDLAGFSIVYAPTTDNGTAASTTWSTSLSMASTVTSGNGSVQVVALQQGGGVDMELDALKGMLADVPLSGQSSIALVVAEGAATDMSLRHNPLTAVNATSPLRVRKFTADSTAPSLLYFDVDMTAMELTLIFDEMVNVSSFRIDLLALHAAPDTPIAEQQNFSTCSTVKTNATATRQDSASVVVSICQSDMTSFKSAYPLLSSVDYVYLTASPGICRDVANPPSDFLGGGPYKVNTYIQDYVRPAVSTFHLNMDSGIMDIYFDEPVQPDKADVTGLTLQRANFTGDAWDWAHTLTAASSVTSTTFSTRMQVLIGKADMDLIKMKDGLTRSASSTYLRVDSRAFSDMAGNPVLDIDDGNAIPVSSYSPDVTAPEIHAFSLYHDARLVLYLSEPIRVAQFNVSGIMMMNRWGNSTMNLTKLSYVETTDDNLVVPLDLSGDWALNTVMGWGTPNSDISRLGFRGIGKTQLQTYLTAAHFTCVDVAGNYLKPIFPRHKLEMGPVVMSYVLDMDAGLLNLTFNLPVFGGSRMKPQAIGIQATSSSRTYYSMLTSCSSSSSANSSEISITICKSDLNLIKGQQSLALGENSTYLTVENNPVLTRSTSTRPIDYYVAVVAIHPYRALQASRVIPDTTRPTLDYYAINLNLATLELSFSEPIVISTFTTSGLTLYGSRTLEPFCILTTTVSSSASYSTESMVLNLNEADQMCVAVYGTGKLLTMNRWAGTDYAGNWLVDISPVTPLEAGSYIKDTLAPSMVNATLNLTSGYLDITFTEAVDTSTFAPTQLSLVYYPSTSSTPLILNLTSEAITFTEAASTLSVELSFAFSLLSSVQDLAYTASITTGLATGFTTNMLFIHAKKGLISDFAQNSMNQSELVMTSITADASSPQLLSFRLDTSSASSLLLYFDEAVMSSTFDPTKVTLYSSSSGAGSYRTLTTSTAASSSSASRVLSVTLTSSDKGAIQAFATSQATTYLSLTSSGAVSDYSPNANPSAATTTRLELGPRVHRAALDVNSATLLLVFSHPVDATDVDTTALLIVGNSSTNTLRLFNSSVTNMESSSSSIYVQVNLGRSFMDSFKVREGLGKSSNATFLAVESSLAKDDDNNAVVAIDVTSPLKLHSFKRDSGHPSIQHVSLDMNRAVLNLTFHEPLRLSLAALQYITLQSQRVYYANSTHSVSFTSGLSSVLNAADRFSRTVMVGIGEMEMAQLKYYRDIARSRANTYLVAVRDCFFDTALPPNTAWSILRSNSHQLDLVVPDTTRPFLLYYDLDFDAGVLTLRFNEPMALESFNVSGVQLMEYAYSGYGGHYRLTNYSALSASDYGREVWVTLSSYDWGQLNKHEALAHTVDQTFLTLDNRTIADTSGNHVLPIPDGEALLVASHIGDTTPPRLLNYTLDMNTGVMVLSFSEMILSSSFDSSGIILESLNRSCFYYNKQGRTSSSCSKDEWALYQSVALTPSKTQYSGADSSTLTITISEYDINAIKDTPLLCKSLDTTHLNIMPSAATDMSGNQVLQIGGLPVAYDPAIVSRGMNAGIYVADSTRGRLRSFNLNMNRGVLTLNFTEPVMLAPPGSVHVEGINLHSTPIISEGRAYQLSGEFKSVTSKPPKGFSNVILLTLTDADLNSLKVLGLGRQDVIRENGFGLDDSVWLSMADTSFVDAMGLPVQPVMDATVMGAPVMKVLNLTVDTKPPMLVRFIVDRSQRRLHMFFDEAIDKESLRVSALQLLVYLGPSTVKLRLHSAQQVPTESPSTIILDLGSSSSTATDWLSLVAMVGAAATSSSVDLYLSADGGAVVDLAKEQNELKPISVYAPLRETRTVCSCPLGTYAVTPCTTVTNVVCRACSTCRHPENYILRPCTNVTDTQCRRCSACRYPYYRSVGCAGGNDTVCTYCRECGPEEFVTEECSSTADRQCSSCRVCTYQTLEQEEGCKHASTAWREENCCKDSRGRHVECKEVNYAEFGISAVSGRRQWVFKKTVPKVAGHTLWTGNFFDWYQATKSDTGYA